MPEVFGDIFIFIVWKIVMLNRGKVRNRGMSPQLMAVDFASSDDMLSGAESVDDEPRALLRSDRLYIVSEPISRPLPLSVLLQDRAAEEVPGKAEIRNRVVDSDIRAAKWAWAILAIAHCWLIYVMVYNLG